MLQVGDMRYVLPVQRESVALNTVGILSAEIRDMRYVLLVQRESVGLNTVGILSAERFGKLTFDLREDD
ncbi:hypothetical protein DD237_007867 [Peronospora effusa]|uniref:Uncharacterized protein n=1 Tax=Peronospora effusa TaxID=542832 RepID=A0A3R7WLR6_9STRA|nr:hypothetical protein DD237_007867 [Peronospora effusa]